MKGWGAIFQGRARFAVFAHHEWVARVKEHDYEGRWNDWLVYVRSRYDMGG